MKHSFTFFITFLYLSSVIFSQTNADNTTKKDRLENRIEKLEGQKENIEKQAELLQIDFELKKKDLENKFSEYKIETDKHLAWLKTITYIVGLGTLGILAFILNYLRKYTVRKAEETVDTRIAGIVEQNRGKIIALIKSQDIEETVKKKSKILVITKTEAEKAYLADFFEKTGIENVTYETSDVYVQPNKDIDLILFDDHLSKANNRHLLFNEYIRKSTNPNDLYVFFGKKFNTDNREKVNYANSKFTLYDRIINSLKYKAISQNN